MRQIQNTMIACALVSAPLASAQAAEPSAQDLIAKNLDAPGEDGALKGLRTIQLKGPIQNDKWPMSDVYTNGL